MTSDFYVFCIIELLHNCGLHWDTRAVSHAVRFFCAAVNQTLENLSEVWYYVITMTQLRGWNKYENINKGQICPKTYA